MKEVDETTKVDLEASFFWLKYIVTKIRSTIQKSRNMHRIQNFRISNLLAEIPYFNNGTHLQTYEQNLKVIER